MRCAIRVVYHRRLWLNPEVMSGPSLWRELRKNAPSISDDEKCRFSKNQGDIDSLCNTVLCG
jgi:hypothetical protein